jgi:hypothetical protein
MKIIKYLVITTTYIKVVINRVIREVYKACHKITKKPVTESICRVLYSFALSSQQTYSRTKCRRMEPCVSSDIGA